MTDADPTNVRDESLDEVDAETVEDLDIGDDAEDVEGGWKTVTTVCGLTEVRCATQ